MEINGVNLPDILHLQQNSDSSIFASAVSIF